MAVPPTSLDHWQHVRRAMPVTDEWAYFDHAGVAPLPAPARDRIKDWADDTAASGDVNWSRWNRSVERIRAAAATLIAAAPEEIAVVRNTTEGLTLVAEGYPWQSGDNVVITGGDFPTNVYPWLNLADRGVEVRQMDVPDGRITPEFLAAHCDAHTRLAAFSWVHYASGWRVDVDAMAEVAHRVGALVCVDAIQGLGIMPLDVRATRVDFLAADGHKWLLGPEGCGVLYVRGEHLNLLRPIGLGWNSVAHSGDFGNTDLVLKPTAARYEGGTYPMASVVGLDASLELLGAHSVDDVSARVLAVAESLAERLLEIGARVVRFEQPANRSAIVSFDFADNKIAHTDLAHFPRACRDAGVVINRRGGRLRASPHVYTSSEDIDRLIETLRGLVR